MRGNASLLIMSRLVRPRQRFTATAVFFSPSLAGIPAFKAAFERNVSDVECSAPPKLPNIGR